MRKSSKNHRIIIQKSSIFKKKCTWTPQTLDLADLPVGLLDLLGEGLQLRVDERAAHALAHVALAGPARGEGRRSGGLAEHGAWKWLASL